MHGDGDDLMMMQMTGAERRSLQEAGVPRHLIQRLEDIFEAMDRHQTEGRGPESRWAMTRFAQRVGEGLDSLEQILRIVGRRLVPRGYWPVQRVPQTEALRWNLFQWARSTAAVFQQTLETHLLTPLQPSETNEAELPRPVAALEESSPAEPSRGAGHEVQRDRSRSPRRGSEDEEVNNDEEEGAESSSSSLCSVAHPSEEPTVDGLVVTEQMQRALEGELLGVWSEPSSGSGRGQSSTLPVLSSSSTSSTSTTTLTVSVCCDGASFMQVDIVMLSGGDFPTSSSSSIWLPTSSTSTTSSPVPVCCDGVSSLQVGVMFMDGGGSSVSSSLCTWQPWSTWSPTLVGDRLETTSTTTVVRRACPGREHVHPAATMSSPSGPGTGDRLGEADETAGEVTDPVSALADPPVMQSLPVLAGCGDPVAQPALPGLPASLLGVPALVLPHREVPASAPPLPVLPPAWPAWLTQSPIVRLGAIPRRRAGESGGGAEADGDGDGSGEP